MGSHALAPHSRPRSVDGRARPSLAQPVSCPRPGRQGAALCRLRAPFRSASWRIVSSRPSSATNFFDRALPSCSGFSSRTRSDCRPEQGFFQRWNVCSEIPTCRKSSQPASQAPPASARPRSVQSKIASTANSLGRPAFGLPGAHSGFGPRIATQINSATSSRAGDAPHAQDRSRPVCERDQPAVPVVRAARHRVSTRGSFRIRNETRGLGPGDRSSDASKGSHHRVSEPC